MPESTQDQLFSLLSDQTINRKQFTFHGDPLPSTLKTPSKLVVLSSGTPNDGFFPINSIQLGITKKPHTPTSESFAIEKHANEEDLLDIKDAFQYGPTEGHPQLLKFLKSFINEVNRPKYDSWDITLTNGTGDSLNKVFNLLVNPGDVVLVESFTYKPVLNNIVNYGGIPYPVSINYGIEGDHGIDVEKLTNLLENWETINPDKKKPKALYTIPTGQNPTGLTISQENRAKIYELAKAHNFIVIEDDPYGYIQLGEYTDGIHNVYDTEIPYKRFIEEILPSSYIQQDNSGHVIRLESFSKTFAPGSRIGFIVAHKRFIKEIIKYAQVSNRAPSGISQIIISNFINQIGGIKGWIDWNIQVSKAYTERKNVLLKTLYNSSSFKKGQFNIVEPKAGMFAIIDINFPNAKEDYRKDIEELRYKILESGVVVVYGKNFAVNDDIAKGSKFIRITLANSVDTDQIKEGGEKLVEGIEKYFESISA
ncbi:hypothetical protein WICMUC_001663 [Wickerhamomyces mucosus]|uniref:Aminotransferase class I/classII large domain-containing protein n=1 Tax=Wickerhamomyces mucosus TaxID=1378264 RepID=A0A9P8PV37_9ASCO|nr:hypothetical protein WICMUC_001663 [Wickerhamomyces mucosus]